MKKLAESSRARILEFTVLVLLTVVASAPAAAEEIPSQFGKPNPAAPAQLQEFAFLIGEFSRQERTRNRDGSWQEWQEGEWNARYFMDGMGIIDETRNYETGIVTANTRVFDESAGKWKVIWIQMPGYNTLVAEGGKDGDGMALINPLNDDRWVFSEISEDGYVWTLHMLIQGQYVPVKEIRTTRR